MRKKNAHPILNKIEAPQIEAQYWSSIRYLDRARNKWNPSGIVTPRRFLRNYYLIVQTRAIEDGPPTRRLLNVAPLMFDRPEIDAWSAWIDVTLNSPWESLYGRT